MSAREMLKDAQEEYLELDRFLASLPLDHWRCVTPFYEWTVADQVMHLMQVDEFALLALRDSEDFAAMVAGVRARQAKGIELSQMMREQYAGLAGKQLLKAWRDCYKQLLDEFAQAGDGAVIPWFGPSMTVESFAAARQMEVWAHGQDIYDVEHMRRANTDRIKNICTLGVKTHGWSFRNRCLEKPVPPRVELVSPSGEYWLWNESGTELVSGLAEEFALIVTQRRHVTDTAMTVTGPNAQHWMTIAQCFAGPSADGPQPGERQLVSSGT